MGKGILLVVFLSLVTIGRPIAPGITREQQLVNLALHVLDSEANLVESCPITLYHLTDKGPMKLVEGFVTKGSFSAQVKIPRVYKTTVVESGNLLDVYAAVNLWVTAVKGTEVGSMTFSVDPTLMDWPVSSHSVVLEMEEIPISVNEAGLKQLSRQQSLSMSSPPDPPYSTYTYKYTTVLEFTTWTQIEGGALFPEGSKIRLESEHRFWNYVTGQFLGPWQVCGLTTVTMDDDVETVPLRTGKKKYTIKFNFKYMYQTIDYAPQIGEELIYAVDTAGDPEGSDYDDAWWSGSMPGSYQAQRWIDQEEERGIYITGGYNYVWSLSIGFSIGDYWTGSVSLGITVQPVAANKAKLIVKSGTWTEGYKVHAVSVDGTWRKSYCKWEVEP